jgi:predicted nucleic acid-binding protein
MLTATAACCRNLWRSAKARSSAAARFDRAFEMNLDHSDGIRAATAAGANVIRTPGIYRMAKDRHLIPAAGPKLDGLKKAAFWLRDEHYRMILRSVGE